MVFPAYNSPRESTPMQGADLRGVSAGYHLPVAGTIDGHTRYDATCRLREVGGLATVNCQP